MRWPWTKQVKPEPVEGPAPAPAVPVDLIKLLRERNTRRIILPDSGIEIEVNIVGVREEVEAGLILGAVMPSDENVTEEQAQMMIEQASVRAKRMLCAAAFRPRFGPVEDITKGIADVNLLSYADLLYAYGEMVDQGYTLFYGVDRRLPLDDKWRDDQLDAAGFIDYLARRYGHDPTEMELWSKDRFTRLLAYHEAGNYFDKKAARK